MTTIELTAGKNFGHRSSVELCDMLNRGTSPITSIRLSKNDGVRQCNAKSLIGLLSLSIRKGDIITAFVNGNDHDYVIKKLTEYIV